MSRDAEAARLAVDLLALLVVQLQLSLRGLWQFAVQLALLVGLASLGRRRA